MKYVEPSPVSKLDAERILLTGTSNEICGTLVNIAFFERDLPWAQKTFLDFTRHENADVASLAATCIGHLARIHRTLDLPTAIARLNELRKHRPTAIAAKHALDDIAIYVQGRRV